MNIPRPLSTSVAAFVGTAKRGPINKAVHILGYPDFEPKFARKYMDLKEQVKKAIKMYSDDVKKGDFPSEKESFN